MPLTTEKTTFTRDVQGRYLCNNLSEVNAWKNSGGRPFDVIVIGGGTFGAAIAEHIWFRQKVKGGGLRTLILEAGLFTIPEHVQHTGIQGFTDPSTLLKGGEQQADLLRTLGLDSAGSLTMDDLRNLLKLEAPLAVQAHPPHAGFFPLNKFSTVPLMMKAARTAVSDSNSDDVKKE